MSNADDPQIASRPSGGTSSGGAAAGRRPSLLLYTQVLIAVACGAVLGVACGQEPYLGGLRNDDLGRFGMLVVTLLKTLAVPLIFFAILDAIIRTSLPLRQGTKLLVICLVNV